MKKVNLLIFIISFISINCSASELQTLVDKANHENKTVILKKGQVYELDKFLTLYDGITIKGNGAILTQSNNWKSLNDKYDPLIRLVNVKNVILDNLIINHDVNNNLLQQPAYSIIMFGAQNCKITNCVFENLGYSYNDKTVKGNPFILILSQDAAKDFSYLPRDLSNQTFNTSDNLIDRCKFINNKTYISFAIRLLTLWTNGRTTNSIKNKTQRNVISNSQFIGEYDWNTIELAGPGTIFNTISYNLVNGKSVNNIDVDKGASNNIINGNTVMNSGLPKRHFKSKSLRFAAIAIHGSNKNLTNDNNSVENNVIKNIKIDDLYNITYLYSCGILSLYTNNTTIKNNTIDNLFDKQKYGSAILMDQENINIKIENNHITNVYRGIYESLNSRLNLNPTIQKNNINAIKTNLFLKSNKK